MKDGHLLKRPELFMNDVIIDEVSEHNHLGIIISNDLKWKKTH